MSPEGRRSSGSHWCGQRAHCVVTALTGEPVALGFTDCLRMLRPTESGIRDSDGIPRGRETHSYRDVNARFYACLCRCMYVCLHVWRDSSEIPKPTRTELTHTVVASLPEAQRTWLGSTARALWPPSPPRWKERRNSGSRSYIPVVKLNLFDSEF